MSGLGSPLYLCIWSFVSGPVASDCVVYIPATTRTVLTLRTVKLFVRFSSLKEQFVGFVQTASPLGRGLLILLLYFGVHYWIANIYLV